MPEISRRVVLSSTVAAAGAAALQPSAVAAPFQVHRSRPLLTSGVSSGDVTTDSAVLWARADRPSRMVATITGPGRSRRTVRGPWVTPGTDHTGKIDLRHLAPGRHYEIEVGFVDDEGRRGQTADVSFATATQGRGGQSFVWTGDTAGQGWGINPDLGGYVA